MQTDDDAYAHRLSRLEGARWKVVLDVQRPYRWNLRRQGLGRCLEVGAGVGRLLRALPAGSVGVDHNALSVRMARERGLAALTPEEFFAQAHEPFDGLLVAHVIEHLTPEDGAALLRSYLPHVRSGGRVFLICPQERGYRSDETHVTWTTGEDLAALAREVGLVPEAPRSFPFPRPAGRWFTHNETTLLAHKP